MVPGLWVGEWVGLEDGRVTGLGAGAKRPGPEDGE